MLRVERRVEASEAEENDAESESGGSGFADCVYVGHFKSPWVGVGNFSSRRTIRQEHEQFCRNRANLKNDRNLGKMKIGMN
jgi:hypothetical protein